MTVKEVITMIRQNRAYLTLENLLIQMIDKGMTITNPFAEFDVFKITDTGYNIDGDTLLKILTIKYKDRLVSRELPCIGRKYIYTLLPGSVDTIETEEDQINYVWKYFYNNIESFCDTHKDNYIRIMQALTAEYNPIENYNMIEYSGSASKVSDTKSTPGTMTATTKVAPFTDDNQNLHQTVTSALKSTAGYEDASQSMRWADGDAFGSTPSGNSVAMQKHTRSGNIGVITSQQLLDQELKLRADSIVDEFLRKAADTCLMAVWS